MKKLLLSVFVIFTFGFYAVYQMKSETIITNDNKSNTTTTGLNIQPTINTTQEPIKNPAPVSQTNTVSAPVTTKQKGQYKDGTFTGSVADAYYGNIQVQAVVSGGKLVDINILDYPQDRSTSVRINSQALPLLKQEAIQVQSANIDAVSGASATSPAFIQSLSSALALARN